MKLKLNYNIVFFFILGLSLLFLFVSESKSKTLTPGDEQYLLTAEKMPTPVGGFESIMKKINYPELAQRSKTEGKVYLLIYVNENGDVDDVKVVKGIGMGCDDEAQRVVKKAKFSPAMDKGAAVKAKFSLALTFKL
jgi:periplasmic protein TonB